MSSLDQHTLLSASHPAYSSTTVRRAFIVWLHCGQRNEFKLVCDYYHHLEIMERSLTPEQRAASQEHEEKLFTQLPPTSTYLNEIFPQLYSQSHTDINHLKTWERLREEALTQLNIQHAKKLAIQPDTKSTDKKAAEPFFTQQSDAVFKYNHEVTKKENEVKIFEVTELEKQTPKKETEKAENIKIQNSFIHEKSGTTKQEIIEVSQMIRNHCKNHLIPLQTFLNEFKEFAERSELKNTVPNVSLFLKRKMIHAELEMMAEQKKNMDNFENDFAVDLSFGEIDDISKIVDDKGKENYFTETKAEVSLTNNCEGVLTEKTDPENQNSRNIINASEKVTEVKSNDKVQVTILKKHDTNQKNIGFSNNSMTTQAFCRRYDWQ